MESEDHWIIFQIIVFLIAVFGIPLAIYRLFFKKMVERKAFKYSHGAEGFQARLTSLGAIAASASRYEFQFLEKKKGTIQLEYLFKENGKKPILAYLVKFSDGENTWSSFYLQHDLYMKKDMDSKKYNISMRNRAFLLKDLPCVGFVKEGRSHKWAKSLGLNKEIQIGNLSFDDKVYIYADDREEDIKRMFAEPLLRTGVSKLLETGFSLVGFNYNIRGVSLVFPQVYTENLTDEQICKGMQYLREMAESLPLVESTKPPKEKNPVNKHKSWLVVGLFGGRGRKQISCECVCKMVLELPTRKAFFAADLMF